MKETLFYLVNILESIKYFIPSSRRKNKDDKNLQCLL